MATREKGRKPGAKPPKRPNVKIQKREQGKDELTKLRKAVDEYVSLVFFAHG